MWQEHNHSREMSKALELRQSASEEAKESDEGDFDEDPFEGRGRIVRDSLAIVGSVVTGRFYCAVM